MAGLLEGRIALVTGGTRGLGRAVAAALAEAGARGLLLDRPDAVAAAEALPAGFEPVAGDVTREAEVAAAVAATVQRHGRLDVVVANAGVVPPWRTTDALDFEEWDRVMAINVRGVAITLKQAASVLPAGGSMVAMASINSYAAHAQQMAYTASKHAVLGIVRSAARDLGPRGIRVNALAPGPIATDALLGRIEARALNGPPAKEALGRLAAGNALGRLATAEEVAKAAVFLASDLSSGITGTLLPVDAGLL